MKLAPLTLEQCEQVRIWRNQCLETLRTPYPLTKEMQAEFYHGTICNRNSNHRYWAIRDIVEQVIEVLRPDSSGSCPEIKRPIECVVGMGGITNIQWENRIGEISLIIDPALREKGYGEKAVDLLLDAAFNQMGLNCVFGECYLVNSEGVVFWKGITEKHGGIWTTLRARKFWNGKFWDSLYFDILKDEYDRAKSATTNGPLQSS